MKTRTTERKDRQFKPELYTKADCARGMDDPAPNKENGNEGCIAILNPELLVGEYRKKEAQLFKMQSGFGCLPNHTGQAIFGYFCDDGEMCIMSRTDFIGIANAEVTQYGEKLFKKLKNTFVRSNNGKH